MAATTYSYRLTLNQREDIAFACEIGQKRLNELAQRIENERFTIKRSQIEETIRNELGSEKGDRVASLLFGIASTFRRSSLSADDVLTHITRALATAAPPVNPSLSQWEECRGALKRLLTTRSISLAAKAWDVAYDFERVYVGGRILTSIRPVFDEERERMVGSAIVQTLRLEFTSPTGDVATISIAVDMDDIKNLKTECERAVHKAREAQTRIELECGVDVIVPGGEDSE